MMPISGKEVDWRLTRTPPGVSQSVLMRKNQCSTHITQVDSSV